MLALIAAIVVIGGYVLVIGWAAYYHSNPVASVITILTKWLIGWIFIFALTTFWILWRTPFRAADGHPLLASLLTAYAAWVSVGLGWWIGDPVDLGSATLNNLVALSGATSLTGLSVFEFQRYRNRYGVGFRTGPWPTRWPHDVGRRSGPRNLKDQLAKLVLLAAGLVLAFGLWQVLGFTIVLFGILSGYPSPLREHIVELWRVWPPFLIAWYILRYLRARSYSTHTVRGLLRTWRSRFPGAFALLRIILVIFGIVGVVHYLVELAKR
jgi:hypothetical protein